MSTKLRRLGHPKQVKILCSAFEVAQTSQIEIVSLKHGPPDRVNLLASAPPGSQNGEKEGMSPQESRPDDRQLMPPPPAPGAGNKQPDDSVISDSRAVKSSLTTLFTAPLQVTNRPRKNRKVPWVV